MDAFTIMYFDLKMYAYDIFSRLQEYWYKNMYLNDGYYKEKCPMI
jgi:hypothetical protein